MKRTIVSLVGAGLVSLALASTAFAAQGQITEVNPSGIGVAKATYGVQTASQNANSNASTNGIGIVGPSYSTGAK